MVCLCHVSVYTGMIRHFYRHSFDEEAVDQSRLKPCLQLFFSKQVSDSSPRMMDWHGGFGEILISWYFLGGPKLLDGFTHFLFSMIYGDNHPNWLSYFSRWLKPPSGFPILIPWLFMIHDFCIGHPSSSCPPIVASFFDEKNMGGTRTGCHQSMDGFKGTLKPESPIFHGKIDGFLENFPEKTYFMGK